MRVRIENRIYNPRTATVVLMCCLVALGSVVCMFTVGSPNAYTMFFIVAVVLFWKTENHGFIISLMPFLAIMMCWTSMRGFADNLSPFGVHVTQLADAERWLFLGRIPSAWLQQQPLLHNDVFLLLMNVVYGSHFVYPLILALVIWFKKREFYWRYISGILLMSFIAFVFFYLYPAAPPWWASHFHKIPETIYPSLSPKYVSVVLAGPNPVAAMPSLHGAWAVYFAITCFKLWGRSHWWALCVPVLISFATVYLGHHYVVDLIAGGILAAAVSPLLTFRLDTVAGNSLDVERREGLTVPALSSSPTTIENR